MITTCDKCGDGSEAKLSLDTDEIICTNCKTVLNLSSFMKNSLRASGDVIRDTKPKIPMGGMLVVCQKCSKEFSAELVKKTLKCFCPKCKTEFKMNNLSKERLVEYKIFVGETEERFAESEAKEDAQEIDPNPSKKAIASVKASDSDEEDIKNLFKPVSSNKPKVTNKTKEKALKTKGLKKTAEIKRITVDSNGDPIGGKVIFHPEDEESDAQLTDDLENSKPKTTSKKVKNKQ